MVRAFRSEWLKILRRGMLLGSAGAMSALSILGIVLVTLRRCSTFSSSGTDHGSFSISTCQNWSYAGTGAN